MFTRCWSADAFFDMSNIQYQRSTQCHLARRRRAYAPTSNTSSHDIHEKINSWVSASRKYGFWDGIQYFAGQRYTLQNYNMLAIFSFTNDERPSFAYHLHKLHHNYATHALPCIRRLSPQYEQQSKLSCPTETTR